MSDVVTVGPLGRPRQLAELVGQLPDLPQEDQAHLGVAVGKVGVLRVLVPALHQQLHDRGERGIWHGLEHLGQRDRVMLEPGHPMTSLFVG